MKLFLFAVDDDGRLYTNIFPERSKEITDPFSDLVISLGFDHRSSGRDVFKHEGLFRGGK